MHCSNLTNNPISSVILEFVKTHLRITGNHEDSYITILINSTLDNLLSTTHYSAVLNNYVCSLVVNPRVTTQLYNDCKGSYIAIPLIQPLVSINSILVNDNETNNYIICKKHIKIYICNICLCNDIKIDINTIAGVASGEVIPSDFLMLIALMTESLYDCDCSCNLQINKLIYKYSKQGFYNG